MYKARYTFIDGSQSESSTTVTLSDSFRVDAVLSLADALRSASSASLTRVDVYRRIPVPNANPPPSLGDPVRIAIPAEGFLDGYHAVFPILPDYANDVLSELNSGEWTTASGRGLRAQDAASVSISSSWRNYNPPYLDGPDVIVVLPARLWRDLLVTSMALDSETRRYGEYPLARGLARYQLISLVQGVDVNQILSRLDAIIQLLQDIRTEQGQSEPYLDEIEPLLAAILELL